MPLQPLCFALGELCTFEMFDVTEVRHIPSNYPEQLLWWLSFTKEPTTHTGAMADYLSRLIQQHLEGQQVGNKSQVNVPLRLPRHADMDDDEIDDGE